jgi:dCMP deaminase
MKVPSGERHEICRAVHAEQNVIIQAAIHGKDTRGSTIYVTCQPCVICAKILVNAGIRKVIYVGGYPDKDAVEIMTAGGVELENYFDR